MKVRVRLLNSQLSEIHRDLDRRHAFALERVGFLICGSAMLPGDEVLLCAQEWMPVHDDHYIDDPRAGATIGPGAFRKVLEVIYNRPSTVLHLHRHDHHGVPGFSRIDSLSMAQFVPGFFNACSSFPHGAVVLSHDSAAGAIWLRKGSRPVAIQRFDFIGQPISSWRSA